MQDYEKETALMEITVQVSHLIDFADLINSSTYSRSEPPCISITNNTTGR